MNPKTIGNNFIAVIVMLALGATLSVTGSTCHAAWLDTWLDGSWSGVVQTQDKKEVSINLLIQKDTKSPKGKVLAYDDARGCTITGGYAGGVDEKKRSYVIKMSNGGFCDKLINGVLSFERQADNELVYEVTYSVNTEKRSEKGLLSRNK